MPLFPAEKIPARNYIFWIVLIAVTVVAGFVVARLVAVNSSNYPQLMKISSPAFENNAEMPVSFTCLGDGHNPPLSISEVPGDAAALALVTIDPDAPSGEFVHWLAWNIDRNTTLIDEGLPPPMSLEGQNSLGKVGYVAPCPPSGTHHYRFQLYALDKELELDENTTKDELVRAMTGHIIDEAELVGLVTAIEPDNN